MRKSVIKVYGWIFCIGFAYYVWCRLTKISIPCFYLNVFGMKCPGCGSTTMFFKMANLDFAGAFWCNPVVFILLFLWNIIGILCFWGKVKFLCSQKFLTAMLYISIGVSVVFGVVRNLF